MSGDRATQSREAQANARLTPTRLIEALRAELAHVATASASPSDYERILADAVQNVCRRYGLP